ncbi:MAG: flagellar hook-associated protein FlgL [Pseudomonadales bacterium]|nr:flagellar hook-associated protein FlgL [Pseudomonadales bacterium]
MRISTIETFNRGLSNIQRVTAAVADSQNQISTGRKFDSPSDDPVAATRILQINQELAIRSQYKRNITSVTNRLSLEEAVLVGVGDILQRIREISIQAGAGSLSQQDRAFLAEEVDVRTDEMLGLLNTKDSNGEFIFAGYKGGTQPFVDGGGGGYKFQGDEGERLVQIGATTFISSRDSGKQIFEVIEARDNTFITSNNPRNTGLPQASISVGQVIDQAAFDLFYPGDAYIEFNPVDDLSPPQQNYTVRRMADNRVIEGLEKEPYISGETIDFSGISVRVSGNADPGDSFVIESSKNQSILTTMSRMVDGLRQFDDTREGREFVADLVAASITNLDNAQTNLLETRSSLGARLNTLESTLNLHEEIDIVSRVVLSELQDVDFAEAVSRLSLETFILEAAQQSFARIANLSLFKFL